MSSSNEKSRVLGEVDFEKNGRQSGYLRAPLSRNTSGWGIIEIPIVVIKNGQGPTVLLTAGIHGDEYEGQIAISRAAQDMDPGAIQGRVILMPAINIPAVLADTRLSPADNRDMNRCFPGNPKGTISEMLAHYLDSVILPLVDISVDMHSAGHSGDAVPSTNMHQLEDAAAMARTLDAAAAFGAPYNVVFTGVDEGATLTSSVERRKILSLGTELGGWGRVCIEGLRIGRRGIDNILKHAGVIEGQPDTRQADGGGATRHMVVDRRDLYSFAPQAGTFEPCNLVGEQVHAGQPAGYLHFVEDVDRAPIELLYQADGVLWMSAGPGRVARGDTVAVVMRDYTPAAG